MAIKTGFEMLGAALIYVGFVLIVNGLWILGRISNAKDVAILNLFTGIVTGTAAFHYLLLAQSPLIFAQSLLFSFTYFWVFVNAIRGVEDQRAFGWYCLLVAITAVISGLLSIGSAATPLTAYLTFLWFLWAVLWASFWYLLAVGTRNPRWIGVLTLATGILTYIPAVPSALSLT